MIIRVIKVIIRQLVPYYLVSVGSIIGCAIGYGVSSVIGLNPVLGRVVGGFVPVTVFISLLPVHFERENRFKFLTRVPLSSKYENEVVRSIIEKCRSIEKEMDIKDFVSYVIVKKHNMGVVKYKGGYIVFMPKDYIKELLDNTYVLITHELAHIKLRHLEKMLVIYAGTLLISASLGVLFAMYSWMSVPFIFLIPIFSNAIFNRYVGKLEDEADKFAVKFVNPQEFASTIKIIAEEFDSIKMVNEIQQKFPLISRLFIPHKSINERIEELSL